MDEEIVFLFNSHWLPTKPMIPGKRYIVKDRTWSGMMMRNVEKYLLLGDDGETYWVEANQVCTIQENRQKVLKELLCN